MSISFNSNNTFRPFVQVQNQMNHSNSMQNSQIFPPAIPQQTPPIPAASLSINDNSDSSSTLTKVVASTTVLAAIFGLFAMKGSSGKMAKKLNKYLNKLDDKIHEYTQKHKTMNTLEKWYLNTNKAIRKSLTKLQVLNNFTAFKDAGFKWLCNKLYLTKPMNWVTKQFKKITINASTKAYQNARNVADTNIAELRKMIPLIKDKEQASALSKYLDDLEKEFTTITNATSRNKRLATTEKTTENIGDEVSKELWEILKAPKQNWKKLTLYQTEIKAAAGKDNLKGELQKIQRDFSFDIKDISSEMANMKDKISALLSVENNHAREKIRTLSKQIKKFDEISGKGEAEARVELVNQMKNQLATLKTTIKKEKLSLEDKGLINTQINEIEKILQNYDKKGKIEEILTILRTGLKDSNSKAYEEAKKLTNGIKIATNKAFEKEIKLYDKFAEYSVGSAPTDVLGLILPIGFGAYAISKGESKEDKVSAGLIAGIPIIGAVGTAFYAAARMWSNMFGLAAGAVVGLILNAIGSKADSKYKNYLANKTYTQQALAAYKGRTANTAQA